MKVSVILPAAGTGSRFAPDSPDAPRSKIEHELEGRAVFLHALDRFIEHPEVVQVILAVNPRTLNEFRDRWGEQLAFLGVELVAGGSKERWETVSLALRAVVGVGAVGGEATHVAVHDAARPLVSRTLIDRVFAAAAHHDAVIPGLPVSDTLKRVADAEPLPSPEDDPADAILGLTEDQAGGAVQRVVQTVPRGSLVAVQTPQVFERSLLERAYENLGGGSAVTDDASVVEALGEPVYVVEGDPLNLKVTRPEDAELAAAILRLRREASQQAAAVRLFAEDDI